MAQRKNRNSLSNKDHFAKQEYQQILKESGNLNSEKTFVENDSKGSDSTSAKEDNADKYNPKVRSKSFWLVIKDNAATIGILFGFASALVGVTIYLESIKSDIKLLNADVVSIKTKYTTFDTQPNSTELNTRINDFRSEFSKDLDSIQQRLNRLEQKIYP
jgi:hypothetical protein